MAACCQCRFFTLHLSRNTNVGLCSQWIQTEFASSNCDWFKAKIIQKVKYNPWSKNGKTYREWFALKYGKDCMTGNPLEYWKIKSIAEKFKIPTNDIERFKRNEIKQLQLI